MDAFFITLSKSEKDYSPSTLYEDYAINEKLFHWQSQSKTSVQSPTGQRYINHLKKGFDWEGYEFVSELSYENKYVFVEG